jgi:tetratricopeptide (TPR) repeat protein
MNAALEAEGLAEYATLVLQDVERLECAAQLGQKQLLERLREIGVAKMGQRQKVARIFRENLEQQPEGGRETASKGVEAQVAATVTPCPPPPPPTSDTTDFWASLMEESADATSAGDLGAVQLDASQYSAPVRVLTRGPGVMESLASAAPTQDRVTLEKRTAAYPGADSAGANTSEMLGAYRERGNAAFGRQDYESAQRWYEKILSIPTDDGAGGMSLDHAAALSNLAACALERKPPDPTAALKRLQRLLAARPTHVKGRLRAGRCCVMLGQLHAALTHYEVAYDQEKPKTPAAGLQLRYTPPTACDAERKLLMGPDGKTPLSELAQQAFEGKATAARMISHCERARSLARGGRTDEALYLARSVGKMCSHSPIGHSLVVEVLEGKGRLWEAQQEAEEVVERFPEDEALGVALSRLLARRGKTAEAEARLADLVRSRPGEECRALRARRGLKAALQHKEEGNAAYSAGDFTKAGASYTAAMEADCEGCLLPTLLANRAQARLQDGREADALTDCDKAIGLDADNVKMLLRRAACHVALKHLKEAKEDYDAVLALDPYCAAAQEFVDKYEAAGRRSGRSDGGARGGAPGGLEEEEEEEVDPYELLGVPRDANAATIKAAYRKMALKHHPDKHADSTEEERARAEEAFRELNLAHSVLADPIMKRQYDAGGRIKDITRGK